MDVSATPTLSRDSWAHIWHILSFTDICRCLFEAMDEARTAFGTDQDIIFIYEQKPEKAEKRHQQRVEQQSKQPEQLQCSEQ